MAMELLEGEQLAEVLDRDGPLPLERIADVLLPVLSAVAAAHEAGVLHRDLKPENIFLARRQRREHPMLLDFGISKVDSGGPARPLTAAGDLLGTPAYMSPEQVLGGMARYEARSDQYALGVVLYECATGRLPFRDFASVPALMTAIAKGGAPLPSSLRADIPATFDALVSRAMSLAPEDRFPSVLHLGRALFPFAGARTRALWTDEFAVSSGPREAPLVLSPAQLRELPLFASAPEAEIAKLPAVVLVQRFTAGAALFEQGGAGGSCFVVVSGEVELARTHGAETWPLATVGPGALLGLASLWDDAPRPVSGVARAGVVALQIKRGALDALGVQCPAIADRLHDEAAATAVRRLRDASERVAALDRRSAEITREAMVRLAAALGEWSVPLPRMGR
jgi:serine/threonine-protein kinase